MNEEVTITKIIVPRRRFDLLSRQRLLDLLENLLEYRLILVTAPAGYGKTSLLIDLAHQVEYPVCWLALDSLDQNIYRFLIHFIAAIQYQFPDFGVTSFAVLQSAQQAGMNLDHLVSTIVNEIYEHVSEHFVVVLDDYHLVEESTDINYFINRFAQEIDENCHLAIASRSSLSLPDLPLLVGRSQVVSLSSNELAFCPEEIKAILRRIYDQSVSDEEAQKLAGNTEGWITGLLLSTETMWKGMTDQVRVARVTGIDVYGYLVQQVLNQQSLQVRDFLLRTSLLEEFNAQLCQSVLGHAPEGTNWSQLIEALLHNNLFVQPVESDGTWLRYHHLFRDFLQEQLSKEQPQEEESILRRLVDVYSEREEWEKAYAVCQRLGDDEVTITFIEKAGIPLITNGRFAILAKWIDALSDGVLSSHPTLLAQRGRVAFWQGEIDRALSLLNEAELYLQEENHYLARALTWRAWTHCKRGKYQIALRDVNRALGTISRVRGQQIIHAEALEVKGECLYLLGHPKEALEHIQFALDIYTALEDQENKTYANMVLGVLMMERGQYKRANGYYSTALNINYRTNNLVKQSEILLNLGVSTRELGDLIQAHAYLQESLNIARQIGYLPFEALSLANLGYLFASLQLFDAASEMYQQAKMAARCTEQRHLVILIGIWESELARTNHQLEQAQGALDVVEGIAKKTEAVDTAGYFAMEMGCLSLANEGNPSAIKHFEQALDNLETAGIHPETAKANLYLAFIHHAAGEDDQTARHLTSASQVASKMDSLFFLIPAGRDTKGMLKDAIAWPEVGAFAVRLIDMVERFERELPRLRRLIRQQDELTPLTPPDITIQAFGEARLELNGEPVTKPEWANQRKVRELFFLLLEYPTGLTKEAICDALWPDREAHRLPKQFNNAIYRLRRALGKETVSFNQRCSRYLFNWGMDYHYDVESFMAKLKHARETKDPKIKIPSYKDAIEIYSGPYLPRAEGIWTVSIREDLQRAYFEAILVVAEFHFQEADYIEVLEYCSRILSEDPCQEATHRLVLRVHAARGNRPEVIAQYERCKQNLQLHLDVTPSPETKELFKQLVGE